MKTWLTTTTWLTAGLGAVCLLSACTGSIEGGSSSSSSSSPSSPSTPMGSNPVPTDDTPSTPSTPATPPPGVGANGLIDSPESVINSEACQSKEPGRAPLRRLSNAEYQNTVGDLLGDATLAGQAVTNFVPENESLGFRNSADLLVVTSLIAQQYMDGAEQLSTAAVAKPGFSSCASANDPRSCAQDFIRSFGQRAYRRPLTDAEVQRYLQLYDTAIGYGDANTGIQWIVYTLLQSPHFLYRVEAGQPATASTPSRPTAYEMASRLSYLFWQSAPDDALLSAAASGKLDTPAQIEAQARQMLQDPKADRVYEFFDQWLDVDRVASMQRDPAVFPDLDPNLPQLFREETRNFTLDLLHSPSGSLTDLFTAPYTYANQELAKHYGITGPTSDTFERVERPDSVGFFSQAGFITAHDKPTRSSIVLRGLKIRTDLLCELIGAPPPNVQINLDQSEEANLSQRERLEQHRTNPTCNACHELMDPVGLVFEGYDAVGRSRSTDESGAPIDTSSTISKTKDIDGPVSGPAELAARMANSEEVRQCYTRQAFRFFYGRELEDADLCSRAELTQAFRDSNYNLRELLVSLTQTDAFLYRPEIKPAMN